MDNYDKWYFSPLYDKEKKLEGAVYKCSRCENWIYEGESYLEIEGDFYCDDCVEELKRIA